ncbi:MAG: chromosome segregation protein SMC, partial [Pseudomonadota bacterium]
MRLEKIKLSGFKSFVDPTSIPVPAGLFGIVGPNGCGKSNIIDAVRWVMGESSAKHLRGESMADVIFNGSSARKPVSMASVELIFDNSEGRAGGEYAKYNTIALKRQVTRDGQSVYLLNGARCRRKDITDMFLGTGLGSRSYAIIEQGTISRLVDARPDDLRVYIEEAAGISKYKERRHETEIRMRHTRDNLERLNDLRDEVEKQLKHLERQANKAEKYIVLKKQERQAKQELLAIRWQSYNRLSEDLESKLNGIAEEHNRFFTEQREVDALIADARDLYKRQQGQVNECQGDYYLLSSDITRLEETIKHNQMTREETGREIERLRHETAQMLAELEEDREHLAQIKENLAKTSEAKRRALEREEEAVCLHTEVERELRRWQTAWENHQGKMARFREQAEIQRVRIKQVEENNEQLSVRFGRLQEERHALSDDDLNRQMEALQHELDSMEAEHATLHERLSGLSQLIREQRQNVRQQRDTLDEKRSKQQSVQGTVASLELLQQHAIGKDRHALSRWLNELSLEESPRLAQELEVEPGWETAVETVLGAYLEAVCVEDADPLMSMLNSLDGDRLSVFETRPRPGNSNKAANEQLLVDKLRSPWNLNALFAGIHCTSDLESAREMSRNLRDFESVVTRRGEWLGPGWMLIPHDLDDKGGILQREKELRVLKERQTQLVAEVSVIEQQLDETEESLQQAENQREELERRNKIASAELSMKNAELSGDRARLDHNARRIGQITEEIDEIGRILADNDTQLTAVHLSKSEAEQAFLDSEAELLSMT